MGTGLGIGLGIGLGTALSTGLDIALVCCFKLGFVLDTALGLMCQDML